MDSIKEKEMKKDSKYPSLYFGKFPQKANTKYIGNYSAMRNFDSVSHG